MESVPEKEYSLVKAKNSKATLYAGVSFVFLLVAPFTFLPLIIISPVSAVAGIIEVHRFEKTGAIDGLGKVLSWCSLILSVLVIGFGLIFLFWILDMFQTIYETYQGSKRT